ncbi:MAG: MOSC domain-containing protein [Nitrospirae bacterium]|nr:MAG: MOSC domain-containing protein [Nitrospirota bacterium]
MNGTVRFVCTSKKKGMVKHPVPRARLVADHGVEGDAHAGPGHRQVSLLLEADIDAQRALGLELEPGAFGENLVVTGLPLARIGIGSRLAIGEAEVEITQIGKVCHDRCAIYYRTGDCIMPRLGVFGRVVAGGEVAPGAPVRVLSLVERDRIQVAVVTCSDTCSRGEAVDTAGPAVARLAEARLGAHVALTAVVPDEGEAIEAALKGLADRGVDLVLTCGGTGCGPRDVTPEATLAVVERQVPGLAERMRAASAEATPHAWLSRAVAGIRRHTLIVNLPGSERAATENLEAILEVLPHAVRLLRGHTAHAEDPRPRPEAAAPAARPLKVEVE